MFTHGNNFSGSSFDRPTAEDNNSGFNDYLFGTPSGDSQSSTFTGQTHGFDLEAAVAGPSTTVADNWWLGPSLDGDSIRYSGSTVLDGAWNGFTSPYTSQTRFVPGNDALERNGIVESDALMQRYFNVPGCEQPFVTGLPPVIQPLQIPSLPPAAFTGPIVTPSTVQELPWSYSSLSAAPSIATGQYQFGVYDQPLTTPDFGDQWVYPASVDKGKARATDLPLANPSTAGNNMWQYERPHTPQRDCASSNPHLNADVSAPVASSSGPQRSERSTTWGVEEPEKGKVTQKRAHKKALPPDVDWVRTSDRFYWKMIEVYMLQPSGRFPTPEGAYAQINKFTKEDFYQSPLMVKELGTRPSRELEQYLTQVLNVLYPAREGEKRDTKQLLDQVAGEVEHGLFMTNDAAALRDGPSSKTKPEDLDESAKRVQHRRGEKRRRDASHETLKRMSFFFKAPPGSLSRNEVLFFAITYLLFGARVFGDDGFVIAFPKF